MLSKRKSEKIMPYDLTLSNFNIFLFAYTVKRIFPADSFKYKDGQCQHEAAVCGD